MPVESEAELEKRLWEERCRMKKALHRVEMAERWVAEGEKIDPKLLSLAWHFKELGKEERAKKRVSEAERKRDALAVAEAVKGPLPFESLP